MKDVILGAVIIVTLYLIYRELQKQNVIKSCHNCKNRENRNISFVCAECIKTRKLIHWEARD